MKKPTPLSPVQRREAAAELAGLGARPRSVRPGTQVKKAALLTPKKGAKR